MTLTMLSRVALRCGRPALVAANGAPRSCFSSHKLASVVARGMATHTDILTLRGSKDRKMNLRQPRATAPVQNLEATFTIRVSTLRFGSRSWRSIRTNQF